jgi:hypothetical protein
MVCLTMLLTEGVKDNELEGYLKGNCRCFLVFAWTDRKESVLLGRVQPDELYETGASITQVRFSVVLVLRVHYVAGCTPSFLRHISTKHV